MTDNDNKATFSTANNNTRLAHEEEQKSPRGLSGRVLFLWTIGSLISLNTFVFSSDLGDLVSYAKNENVHTAIQSSRQQLPLLTELVRSHEVVVCPDGLVPFIDTNMDPSLANSSKIPRIVHVTAKSRCISEDFAANLELWRLPGYSIFFHDEQAVDSLFGMSWPEFPHMEMFMRCLPAAGGASKIDVWRVLVLYAYGGIYTDFDNTLLTQDLVKEIRPEDESFFLSDVRHRTSQWFHAMTPRHPIAYLTMMSILKNLSWMNDISYFKAVFTTGPAALCTGFGLFLGTGDCTKSGTFVGMGNHTARKIPREYSKKLVTNEYSFGSKTKGENYKSMNMTHWTQIRDEGGGVERKGKGCLEYLRDLEQKRREQ